MSNFSEQISNLSSNKDLPEETLAQLMRKALFDFEQSTLPFHESKPVSEIVSEHIKSYFASPTNTNMISTGFDNLDELFGGFAAGEFIVLGGRPGMGKTFMMNNFALNIALKHPVLYVSLELSENILISKLLSLLSEIPSDRINKKALVGNDVTKLTEAYDKLREFKLYINDRTGNYISNIKHHIQKSVEEHQVRIVFIDNLQMISARGFKNFRETELGYICKELKKMAKEYNVCIMVSSQLSRAVETRGGLKKPMLSDLRESGSIEQDADKVLFIWRPSYYALVEDEHGNAYDENYMEIIVAKNRDGKIDDLSLHIKQGFTGVEEAKPIQHNFHFDESRLDEKKEGKGENEPF